MQETSQQLLDILKSNGADFFVSLPCKLLASLIALLEKDPTVTHLAVTREEEGLGICAGAYLGGKTPVMVIQNTGIGNTITSLCSLGLYYQIPVLMLVSHRGTPGERIGAQVPMSLAVKPILDTLGVPHQSFSQDADLAALADLIGYARTAQRPVAALLDIRFWQTER